ncbi:MAG: HAMP domain-containing sensor histidine kinase [Bryobacteraceae bacterium]
MVVGGRRKSIAFFISLGIGLILFIVFLYVGWVLLGWRNGILLFFGVLLTLVVIAGIVLNTTFLVREIRRNAQHDAFINAVTHELKTPVASIRLYLETLQTRPVEESKRREFYQTMLDDSDRLLGTIEQILRTGQIGQTRRPLHTSSLDFGRMVEECMARARRLYHVSEEALSFAPGPHVMIQADAEEVRAAISNLIDNAVKYAGTNPKVRVETETVDDKFVRVRVQDNGPGIPEAERKQIFKRFYRVPGPLATRIKGTGLGLFIVRSVAKRHGGKAWVESDGPGTGSTFVLQLPIAR